jgi:hypothetical protein
MERFCLKSDLNMAKGDKIVFSKDSSNNCFYEILNGANAGILIGELQQTAYLPVENHSFESDLSLVDCWSISKKNRRRT